MAAKKKEMIVNKKSYTSEELFKVNIFKQKKKKYSHESLW